MYKEHAIISNALDIQEIEYLVKKANRLGFAGRNIYGISKEKDNEGIDHIYFHTDLPDTPKIPNCS